VNDVSSTKKQPVQTKVSLECIDNDKLGEMVDLIWERENVNTRQVFEEDTFPNVMNERFDKPAQIDALESAIRWSAPSMIEGPQLLAPFRGSIEIEDYQLEPVSRALRLPRVNLLIADDVGLGKTIEAGLVLEELMARGRVKKSLVVAPASLTLQWQSEMMEKFQLEFKIIDRTTC
jgi:SNF2 family DNA or RNA helicase